MSIADICSMLGIIATIIISFIGGSYKILDRIKTDNIGICNDLKSSIQKLEAKNEETISNLRTHIDGRIDKLYEMVEEKNSSLQQYVNDGIHELKEENKELRTKCSTLHNSVHTLEKDILKFKADILRDNHT